MKAKSGTRSFRILSLDGGGIRGAYSAAFLARIEETLSRPVARFFDLISGTSTGGIVALAAALEIPMADVRNLYTKDWKIIFPRRFGSGLRQVLSAKYDSSGLASRLKSLFGESRIADCKTRVCIPALEVVTGRATTFKTRHDSRFLRDYKLPAWQVAMATCAAPTYFPAFGLENGEAYIDGGLWANNPAMVGLVEAVGYLGVEPRRLAILSLGTGHQPLSMPERIATRPRRAIWPRSIFDFTIQSQAQNVDNQLSILAKKLGLRYFRLSPTLPRRVRLDDGDEIGLFLAHAERDFKTMYRELRSPFFSSQVSPRLVAAGT